MRTTIDLPDSLFREVKAKAARDGVSLKELFTHLIHDAMYSNSSPTSRVTLPLIPSSRVKSIRSITNNTEIQAIFDNEDGFSRH